MKLNLLFLLLLPFVGAYDAKAQQAPFSLTVVPTKSSASGVSITMARNKPEEFFVVLTNVAKGPQAVWETWNSWGYQTIRFEVTTPEGQKTVVSPKMQDFTRNFPSTFLIQPGKHCVYPIHLDEWWEAHPGLRKTHEMPIKLKAIYEVSPTPEAAQYKVWVGRIESHVYSFTLRQW